MRIGIGAGLALAATAIGSGATAQDLSWSGQVRPRFEFRDPSGGGASESYTTMRTRLALEARLDGGLTVFVQPQDVRVWGGETHPLFDFSADEVDLHQAWIRVAGESIHWLTATVGRMEANLGGQRLVGAVDWTPQGQSFDGVHLDAVLGRTHLAVLAFQVNDGAASTVSNDRALLGAYGTVGELGPGAIDLYWLWDRNRAATDTDEHLLGARYAFTGDLTGRFEGTVATGSRADADVSAFMLGARVGTAFSEGRLSATLWYDYLSGDDPATPQEEVFSTLYATNHKFYGHADLFLDVPAHTGGAGLQDLAIKFGWRASPDVAGAVDVHAFRAANSDGLVEARFGEEIDAAITHRYSSALTATAGLSFVFPAGGLREIGRLTEDMTFFYVMLNATF